MFQLTTIELTWSSNDHSLVCEGPWKTPSCWHYWKHHCFLETKGYSWSFAFISVFFLAMRHSHNILSRNQEQFLFLIAENCIETKVWTLGKNTRVDGGQKYSNYRCCWTVFSSDRARNVYMNLHRCFLFSSSYYYTIPVLLCFVFKNCSVYDFIDHLDFLLFNSILEG